MATVRFSKELQDRIIKNAEHKMQPAILRAQESRPDNAWGLTIYNMMFSEVLPVIQQLPAGWCKTIERFRVLRTGQQQCGLSFTLAKPMPWPVKFPETSLAKQEYHWSDDVVLKDNPVWEDFFAEVVAYNDRVKVANARRDEFVAAVKQVIGAYTTLAPALKAWPPLWELIPDDVKDKHREVVTREKKEVTVDVDLNRLTAMAAAAKLGL